MEALVQLRLQPLHLLTKLRILRRPGRPEAPLELQRGTPGRLPESARMVVRNVTRSRRRFLSTVTGVVLALMLIITISMIFYCCFRRRI